MKILYIFPHPDDESFGPALVISKQKKQGHEIYLLTLTKGGAIKERFKYNYSIDEMGEIRYKEMLEVKEILGLDDMLVLDFPDSSLKEVDIRELENAIKEYIEKIKPDVIVTYAVHGISGFHDHIVCHAAVKRVFLELKEKGYLKRLALFTVNKETSDESVHFKINFSKDEDIDCIVSFDQDDEKKFIGALLSYKTYQDVVEKSGIKDIVKRGIYFEFFQEDFKPRVDDLLYGLS